MIVGLGIFDQETEMPLLDNILYPFNLSGYSAEDCVHVILVAYDKIHAF